MCSFPDISTLTYYVQDMFRKQVTKHLLLVLQDSHLWALNLGAKLENLTNTNLSSFSNHHTKTEGRGDICLHCFPAPQPLIPLCSNLLSPATPHRPFLGRNKWDIEQIVIHVTLHVKSSVWIMDIRVVYSLELLCLKLLWIFSRSYGTDIYFHLFLDFYCS